MGEARRRGQTMGLLERVDSAMNGVVLTERESQKPHIIDSGVKRRSSRWCWVRGTDALPPESERLGEVLEEPIERDGDQFWRHQLRASYPPLLAFIDCFCAGLTSRVDRCATSRNGLRARLRGRAPGRVCATCRCWAGARSSAHQRAAG